MRWSKAKRKVVTLARRAAQEVRRGGVHVALLLADRRRRIVGALRGHAGRLVEAARDRHGFLHKFLISLGIAIAIDAALHLLHGRPWLASIEDRAMDWAVGLYRGATPSRDPLVPFTLVDIDDATFEAWGAPPYVPRDRLAELIRAVTAMGPAVLVVDVDLAGRAAPGADEALAALLREHGTARDGRRAVPIILARSFRFDAERRRWEPRASFLEDVVAGNPNLEFASSFFQRDRDHAIRRWRLWETLCGVHETPESLAVVPSMQLLAATALVDADAPLEALTAAIAREIRQAEADSCGPAHEGDGHGHAVARGRIRIGDLELGVPPERVGQRIVFRYAALDQLGPGERYPRHPDTGEDLVQVVSALPISQGMPLSASAFAGRIVVLGGSFREARDLHPTPLGPMPGAYVIVNAIDSLLEYGEIRPISPAAKWAVIAVTVLTMSVIFARFDSARGPIVAGGVILLALLPASILLFKDGYWLDFGIPLFSVWVHRSAARIHERLEGRSGSAQEHHE